MSRGLGGRLGRPVTPAELLAYVYAILCSPPFSEQFDTELEEPGPRVPFTQDAALFEEAVEIGEELLFLHTYGERYANEQRPRAAIPQGTARATVAVSQDPDRYPTEFVYDEDAQELRVGYGAFGPVSAAVWSYEVSGLQVVASWLGYRMKVRAGRKTSPLDVIQPETWATDLTDELLRLLWILERTVEISRDQEALLPRILELE